MMQSQSHHIIPIYRAPGNTAVKKEKQKKILNDFTLFIQIIFYILLNSIMEHSYIYGLNFTTNYVE